MDDLVIIGVAEIKPAVRILFGGYRIRMAMRREEMAMIELLYAESDHVKLFKSCTGIPVSAHYPNDVVIARVAFAKKLAVLKRAAGSGLQDFINEPFVCPDIAQVDRRQQNRHSILASFAN